MTRFWRSSGHPMRDLSSSGIPQWAGFHSLITLPVQGERVGSAAAVVLVIKRVIDVVGWFPADVADSPPFATLGVSGHCSRSSARSSRLACHSSASQYGSRRVPSNISQPAQHEQPAWRCSHTSACIAHSCVSPIDLAHTQFGCRPSHPLTAHAGAIAPTVPRSVLAVRYSSHAPLLLVYPLDVFVSRADVVVGQSGGGGPQPITERGNTIRAGVARLGDGVGAAGESAVDFLPTPKGGGFQPRGWVFLLHRQMPSRSRSGAVSRRLHRPRR